MIFISFFLPQVVKCKCAFCAATQYRFISSGELDTAMTTVEPAFRHRVSVRIDNPGQLLHRAVVVGMDFAAVDIFAHETVDRKLAQARELLGPAIGFFHLTPARKRLYSEQAKVCQPADKAFFSARTRSVGRGKA